MPSVRRRARPIVLQQGDQIHLTSNGFRSANPFVMTSSVKCFFFSPHHHHSAPYAVCSESITWLCVTAAAAVYSYSSDHQAFPLLVRASKNQAWGELRFPSIYLSNSLFSLGKIALTHHKIRKITGTTNRDTGSTMHDKVAEILLRKSCASPF